MPNRTKSDFDIYPDPLMNRTTVIRKGSEYDKLKKRLDALGETVGEDHLSREEKDALSAGPAGARAKRFAKESKSKEKKTQVTPGTWKTKNKK